MESMRFQLLLPVQIYQAIILQAQTEYPNECCGLLAAQPAQTHLRRVEGHYPLINAAASPVEYESDPHSMFAAIRAMRTHGLEIVAVYHSHPTSPPIPSQKDLARNYSPEVVNFILSLETKEPLLRGWWLRADGYEEAEWELTG